MSYDLIGDIHGCYHTLIALLEKLGYKPEKGIYHHPSRRVIFLGDFIDRGAHQRDVIELVRAMMEADQALSVMGNHEFNAIAYATKNPEREDYLRPHSDKNTKQHQAFLDVYGHDPKAYAEVVDWFKTLPLWLELDGLRIIHACWDQKIIDRMDTPEMADEMLIKASEKGTWQYEAIETLLKGKEIPLKEGMCFHDKDGNERHDIRVRWWDKTALTYQDAYMGPESARTHIPDDEIDGDHLVEYAHDAPPVFLGHYWMEGIPTLLAPNIACLDYSVAKSGGQLVAYRWDGEKILSNDKFVLVSRRE